jgi:putative ABC transport system substrate-binding protein
MNRRDTLLALLALGAAPLAAFAQQTGKVWRIGFLATRSRSTSSNPDVYYDAFVLKMRELGYVEGKNLVIEWRFADGNFDRLPGLASELVQMNLEVIVTHYAPAAQVLQRLSKNVPIIITASNDPIGSGFAASLARPGGNVTGFSLMAADLSPKQIELLRIMIPGLSRIAVLVNPSNSGHSSIANNLQVAARQFAISVLAMEANTAEGIGRSFAAMKRERAGAVIVATDGFFTGQAKQVGALTASNKIPSMFAYRDFVTAGGLMSYGVDITENYRRAADYVDKILKGAKPGDLPFEQPMRIYLVVNRKAATALGLPIPQELLLRADEVIE